jgi:hypothetical protein
MLGHKQLEETQLPPLLSPIILYDSAGVGWSTYLWILGHPRGAWSLELPEDRLVLCRHADVLYVRHDETHYALPSYGIEIRRLLPITAMYLTDSSRKAGKCVVNAARTDDPTADPAPLRYLTSYQ